MLQVEHPTNAFGYRVDRLSRSGYIERVMDAYASTAYERKGMALRNRQILARDGSAGRKVGAERAARTGPAHSHTVR
jgi:hypothetical protein